MLLALSGFLASCAASGMPRADHGPRAEVGLASFYAHDYHRRRTASGAVYDENALTAAHPSLAFGARVRVTNTGNGRSVVVTINDRGPFTGGRIIDVSYRAARHLGFVREGIARVQVEPLR
ncbi:MAG: hypothetical protein A2V63_05745 [Candidatus Eisenbacteria bacterium RBG_19FT_COMBO_70_11]|nr:MAG: hypothetical protein A2V63_05745 [Candidatus Eisenbacteria bacterium RBG_19FT_COMBO_70_11]